MGLDAWIAKKDFVRVEDMNFRRNFWLHNYFLSVANANPDDFYCSANLRLNKKIIKGLINRCNKFVKFCVSLDWDKNEKRIWEKSNKLFCFNDEINIYYVEEAYSHYWKCKPEKYWIEEMISFISNAKEMVENMKKSDHYFYQTWG